MVEDNVVKFGMPEVNQLLDLLDQALVRVRLNEGLVLLTDLEPVEQEQQLCWLQGALKLVEEGYTIIAKE
jgi:hypothetical protein